MVVNFRTRKISRGITDINISINKEEIKTSHSALSSHAREDR